MMLGRAAEAHKDLKNQSGTKDLRRLVCECADFAAKFLL